jgi:hypothetical protein
LLFCLNSLSNLRDGKLVVSVAALYANQLDLPPLGLSNCIGYDDSLLRYSAFELMPLVSCIRFFDEVQRLHPLLSKQSLLYLLVLLDLVCAQSDAVATCLTQSYQALLLALCGRLASPELLADEGSERIRD